MTNLRFSYRSSTENAGGTVCLAVSYWQANDTLRVDHTRANLHSPSKLLQHAPVPPAISSENGTLELRCALNALPRFVWFRFVFVFF